MNNCWARCFGIRAVARTLIGGGGCIFMFCPMSFFSNQIQISQFEKKSVGQNMNIWIGAYNMQTSHSDLTWKVSSYLNLEQSIQWTHMGWFNTLFIQLLWVYKIKCAFALVAECNYHFLSARYIYTSTDSLPAVWRARWPTNVWMQIQLFSFHHFRFMIIYTISSTWGMINQTNRLTMLPCSHQGVRIACSSLMITSLLQVANLGPVV